MRRSLTSSAGRRPALWAALRRADPIHGGGERDAIPGLGRLTANPMARSAGSLTGYAGTPVGDGTLGAATNSRISPTVDSAAASTNGITM